MKKNLIRRASAADLGAIEAIEARWPTTPHWSHEQFQNELSWERAYFIVLELEGAIAGYAVLWKIPPEAQLATIAVKPECSGQSLGRQLLDHLIQACRAQNINLITLEVSARNLAAQRLYTSVGFKVVGLRPKFYNDGADAILMDLALP